MTKVSLLYSAVLRIAFRDTGTRRQLTKDLLAVALRRFRETDDAKKVTFTLKYFPYQLYPEASKEGEGKYEWYKKSRYGDSEEKMQRYTTLMTAYGVTAGINFKFGGTVANTIDAHRLIQRYQEKGPETADKLINGWHEPVSILL